MYLPLSSAKRLVLHFGMKVVLMLTQNPHISNAQF